MKVNRSITEHKFLWLVSILLIVASCQYLARKAYGIKKYKDYSKSDYQKFTKGYDNWSLSYIDSANFIEVYDNNTFTPGSVHFPYQPLQVKIYNSTDRLKFWVVNCIAGGFPNFTWDRIGNFSSFPFKPRLESLADSIDHIDHGQYVTDQPPSDNVDYTVDVYISIMIGRQSKRLLRMVDNALTEADKHYKIRKRIIPSDVLLGYIQEKQQEVDSVVTIQDEPVERNRD